MSGSCLHCKGYSSVSFQSPSWLTPYWTDPNYTRGLAAAVVSVHGRWHNIMQANGRGFTTVSGVNSSLENLQILSLVIMSPRVKFRHATHTCIHGYHGSRPGLLGETGLARCTSAHMSHEYKTQRWLVHNFNHDVMLVRSLQRWAIEAWYARGNGRCFHFNISECVQIWNVLER